MIKIQIATIFCFKILVYETGSHHYLICLQFEVEQAELELSGILLLLPSSVGTAGDATT